MTVDDLDGLRVAEVDFTVREVNFMAVVVTEDDGLTVEVLTTFVVVTVAKLKQ